jgi:hypothetical protein
MRTRPGGWVSPRWPACETRRALRRTRQRLTVSRDYSPPFEFVGGTIERVVIDVSGDPYVDHEKEVLAYLARD